MNQSNPPRVLLIDFLRIAAIAMVLYSHVLITLGTPWDQVDRFSIGMKGLYFWTSWGEIGVTIFLIVSGLSLEFSHGGTNVRFLSYYLRRIARIYPTYYMSLLLALGISASFTAWGYSHYGKPFVILRGFGFDDLLLTLSGFNAFAGKWGGRLVWSSWFIGLLMVLYALYPGLSFGVQRSPWGFLLLLFLVSLGSRYLTERTDLLPNNPKEWFPLNRIFEFGLGIFLMKTLGKEFFLRLNRFLRFFPLLAFFGALSFPLFLIHDPLRTFILFGSSGAGSSAVGILLFLSLATAISYAVLIIDGRIQDRLLRR